MSLVEFQVPDISHRFKPTYLLDHLVQRQERIQHSLDIAVRKVMLAGFFQTVIPLFMPQDGRTNEFGRDKFGLIDNDGGMFPHLVGDVGGHHFTRLDVRFGSNCQRVDKGLGMGSTDIL